MEEDIASAEEALEKIAEEQMSVKEELKRLQPAVEDAEKRLEEVQTRNEKVLTDMKNSQEQLDACLQRQTQSTIIVDKHRAKYEKYKGALEKHLAVVEENKNKRDNSLQSARKLTLHFQRMKERQKEGDGESPPVTTSQDVQEEDLEQVEIRSVPKEPAVYEAKIKRTKDKITKEKERKKLSNEDPTVATEKWYRAKQDLHETQKGFEEAKQLYQETQQDLHERRRRWGKLRKYLEKVTDSRFDNILRLNQSCGELEFDNDTKELNLVVQKNMNDPDSQTKDVKALSGGERSYTTISLLLALGESLETPFRVLDEFDVFLDPQARKLTIQTLIHVAKKMEHRQFIFITPQDLSSVTRDDKVKVFGLKPPKRNQQAGGPSQQLLDFSPSQG